MSPSAETVEPAAFLTAQPAHRHTGIAAVQNTLDRAGAPAFLAQSA